MFLNNCSNTFEQIRQVNVPCSWSCSLSRHGISTIWYSPGEFLHFILLSLLIFPCDLVKCQYFGATIQFKESRNRMGIYGTTSSCKQKHCWPFVPRWHWIDRSILSLNTIRRSVERTTNLIVHNCIHFGSLFVREALEILLLSHSLCPLTTHITDSFTNQFIYGLLS